MAHAAAPSINRQGDINRRVDERTSDDTAVLHDLPQGSVSVAHGFPITPTFDALSYFMLSWSSRPHHTLEAYVHDVTPLTYAPNTQTGADVVVITLRAYRAAYADDSDPTSSGTTHIVLSPYDFVTRENNADKTFYFSDLYVDNTTGLPTSIKFAGSDGKAFDVDYAPVDAHWLVRHVHYEETLHGPLRFGSVHVIADATFDQFAFPAQAPDPRLTPLPTPVPAASPPVAPSAGPPGH